MTPKALLTAYDTAYRATFGAPAPISGAKDAKLAKGLLARYTPEQLTIWLDGFFASRDPFIRQSGYTFGVFVACIGKLIVNQPAVTRHVTTAAPAVVDPDRAARLRAIRAEIDARDYGK